MGQPLCHAVGCNIRIPPNRLMCAYHWFLVPAGMRLRVWQTYRPSQEVDGKPSQEYREAAREAINVVAQQEGQQPIPTDEDLIKTIESQLAKRDNP